MTPPQPHPAGTILECPKCRRVYICMGYESEVGCTSNSKHRWAVMAVKK